MTMRTQVKLLGAAVAAAAMTTSAGAIVLGQVDDFQDGTAQNWVAGNAIPNAPANSPDAGPAGVGDHALDISTNGNGGGAGSRLVGLNRTQWLGDYNAAGVDEISIDLSSPNNVPLDIRLALRGSGGDFVTPAVVVPAGTGVWNNFSFSLAAVDLIAVGGTSASATLGNVTELRLLHNASASIRGTTVGAAAPFAASLLADNITAVPEPVALGLLGLGGLLIARRRA